MDASTIEWLITLLAVHVAALVGVVVMYNGAPCWLQKMAVGLLIIAFLFFCAAYIAALARVDRWYFILLIAFVLEHLAVLVYVFRVLWQRNHGNRHRATAQVR